MLWGGCFGEPHVGDGYEPLRRLSCANKDITVLVQKKKKKKMMMMMIIVKHTFTGSIMILEDVLY